MVVNAGLNNHGAPRKSCWTVTHIFIQPLLSCREWALLCETLGVKRLMAAANVTKGDAFPCIVPVYGLVDGR